MGFLIFLSIVMILSILIPFINANITPRERNRAYNYFIKKYGPKYKEYADDPKILENLWFIYTGTSDRKFYFKLKNISTDIPQKPNTLLELYKWEENILFNIEKYMEEENGNLFESDQTELDFGMVRHYLFNCDTRLLNIKESSVLNLKLII
jgi:hypothetical protein